MEGSIPGSVAEVFSQARDSLEHQADISEQGGAQLSIAEALLISGNGGGAVAWARQARATYLAIPPSPGAARCLLIEGRARRLDHDASAELSFRGALRECQALRPVPDLLEAEIACDLILHLGEESRWSAARSVYEQVRPSRVPDDSGSTIGRADGRRPAPRPARRVMSLYQLAERQAQVAIMAAELTLHPLR